MAGGTYGQTHDSYVHDEQMAKNKPADSILQINPLVGR